MVAANRAAAFGAAARWVVHDLRSPAQTLMLLAGMMNDTDSRDDMTDIFAESCDHLGHSLELLARLLQPPPVPPEIGPVSLAESVHLIADLHRARRSPVRLELDLEAALPSVAGVRQHLEHALLNLLLNAADSLEHEESGVIRLTARASESHVTLVVTDNGPGLPPELADRVFELPGVGEDDSINGLGLPIAREILRLSGGTLDFEPGHGDGSRFVITLPVWRRPAGRAAE